MTNRELLRAPPDTLSPPGRQRRHVLAAAMSPTPCPACLAPLDAVTAAGLGRSFAWADYLAAVDRPPLFADTQ